MNDYSTNPLLGGLLDMRPKKNTLAGLQSQPKPAMGLLGLMQTLPALMNPMISRQGDKIREAIFQREIRQSPWFDEFLANYGEQPDLSLNANYDYRKAWREGVRPERDPYDNNRYHWPSALPGGELLKSENHPTLWKEMYMRKTGKNPDEIGATIDDYWRLP